MVGKVPPVGCLDERVVRAVEGQGRHRDGGQDGPDVDEGDDAQQFDGRSGAGRQSVELREPGPETGSSSATLGAKIAVSSGMSSWRPQSSSIRPSQISMISGVTPQG